MNTEDLAAGSSVFAAGYEKGRADGLRLALSLFQIAVDYYPSLPSAPARALVPAEWGQTFCQVLKDFGDTCRREGYKDGKEKAKAKTTPEGS